VYPGYCVLTGASWTGVEKIVWPWIRKLVASCPVNLGGDMLQTEWRRSDQWGAFSVSTNEAERFAGFRTANGVFVIVDEASSLDQATYDAIMGLTMGGNGKSRVLLIGNPLRTVGPFHAAATGVDNGWHTIHIDALDTPNVKARAVVIPGLLTFEDVEQRKIEWGEDSPEYAARVRGQFPATGQNSFFNGTVLNKIERDDIQAPLDRGDLLVDRDPETRRCRMHRWVSDPNGPIHIWEMPQKTRNYAIGTDISTGFGSSNSVATVVCVETHEVVAQAVRADLEPHDWAEYLDALARWYGGSSGVAYIAHEANGPGLTVGKRLLALGITGLHWDQTEESASPKRSMNPGWHSSRTKKALLLGEYRAALATRGMIQRSASSIKEARDYIYYPSGAIGPAGLIEETEGARDTHGDCVIADALAFRAMREQPKTPLKPVVHSVLTMAGLHEHHREQDRKKEQW
jgi:hypothetical protein